ncbi:unnamed protein product [Moneuplotes crassus]|uniref:Uncharacterized protein n=1 Tax=Euplotes crassus TaxID=5936 RepID=A0AAD1X2Y2_EUPCR|nr:unnamed protein product [Moneuplotes crassus]
MVFDKSSKKVKHLKKIIQKLDPKQKDLENQLEEVVGKYVDGVVTKITKGDVQVEEEGKVSCKEVAINWEVKTKRAAFQKALINLRNQGQDLTQKDINFRLDCLEKLIKCKEYNNIDIYQLGFPKEIVEECNNFLLLEQEEVPAEILDLTKQRKNPVSTKAHSDNDQLKIADELVKKMKQEKLAKKKKEKEKRSMLKEKLKKQEEEYTRRQKEAEERAKTERHEKMMKMKEKEESRRRQILENQNIYIQNLKKIPKPLYKKIEKQFEEEYVMPELEKRKKELAEKRSFMKPINAEEIAQHKRKYEEQRRIEETKRENKFKVDSEYDPKKYHSVFLDNVLDSDAKLKEELRKKSFEVSELTSKKKNYSKLIMETHKPQISKRKKMEMELIKQNLKQPTAFERIKKRMVSSSQNRGSDGFSKLNHSTVNHSAGRRSPRRHKKNDVDWRSMNRIVGIPKPEKNFVKINYLKRSSRKEPEEHHSEYKQNDWDSEIKKYDGEDRISYMKEKARAIEEVALRKEQHLKHGQHQSTEDRNEVNDMIIDSIKAKIALLDNID